MKVAVMDTGVDYDHASLGGDGTARSNSASFPNSRVIAGRDLVGDTFNANPADPAYNPIPTPDGLPDDCQGHGTHVAGIVGASGSIRGIAPGVTFGSYRVFGCGGSTTADIMLAAMEAALADGMHILNMSIGSSFMTWPQYPTAAGSDRLVRNGMIVVASIGNSGADGAYSAGAPGVGRKVIGVASMDNSHVELRTFTVSPDNTPIGYSNSTGAPAAPTSGSALMTKTGTPTTTNDGCNVSGGVPASAAGKVVLIRRGFCTFHEKARNAQTAGAVGVVLYKNGAGRLVGTVGGPVPITIPVVSVSDAEGALLNNRIAAGDTTMTWTAQAGKFANATAGLASSFTSYGLTAELDVKPDVAAPGGLIRSTYPLEKGGSALLSGTSMASPHTAGAAALILEARPGSKADDVLRMLQNTADPARWFGQPANPGLREPVHRQGAGMIDIDDAILATTSIAPSKLALGESEAGPQTRSLTISNSSASEQTYALGNTSAIGTGNTFPPLSFWVQDRSVVYSQAGVPVTSVAVPAGSSATVDVTITTAPAAVEDKTLYGGWLTFASGNQTFRVPYAGFIGDYQSLRILDAGAASAFPTIGRLTGFVSATDRTPVHTPVAAGATFTMTAGNVPYVLAHFAHQVRKIRIEIYNAATNARAGEVLRDEYRERNSRRTGTTNDTNSDVYMPFAIDGTVKKGKGRELVPDGSYYAVFSAEKALGDSANPAHTETWTSAAFTIDRP
ncbi:MAG: S8 family serine peptidase [Actinobacteria bacterium]|nr:S8 family serine peptidase [Actinomycetota bacterium]